MFVLHEDTTDTFCLGGLKPKQVQYLESLVIDSAIDTQRLEFRPMADELLAGIVVATEMMAVDREEAANGRHL